MHVLIGVFNLSSMFSGNEMIIYQGLSDNAVVLIK